MNIQNSVFHISGSKNYVGKRLFSFAFVDYLLNQDKNVLLVDTDTDNPDMFKAHKDLALPSVLPSEQSGDQFTLFLSIR